MLRIGVLSDTHLTVATDDFKATLARLFADVDILLHAGDITSREVYDFLCNWDVRAVRGNMDAFDLCLLPEHRVEEIGGKRIGIMHGTGGPSGIEKRVATAFADVDAIVYGHSHVPLVSRAGGTLLFNPGAFRSPYQGIKTVGIMEIGEEIRVRHLAV
jgi:uncharacterized protein